VARPVGVMCVSRKRASARRAASDAISGSAARVSPTDTACTQINGPGGAADSRCAIAP